MSPFALDPTKTTTSTRVRVRFCDTDMMGIVHHSNYFAYFEAGRLDWVRKRGATYADWASRGQHLPVVEASIKYRAPARFDDMLDVETTLAELRFATMRFDYRITRQSVLLAEGSTRLACVNDEHAVMRFSEEMIELMSRGEIPGAVSEEA